MADQCGTGLRAAAPGSSKGQSGLSAIAYMRHRDAEAGCTYLILEQPMNLIPHLGPIASLIAGVLILIMPRLLNYIVAIYLIVIGLLGLVGK